MGQRVICLEPGRAKRTFHILTRQRLKPGTICYMRNIHIKASRFHKGRTSGQFYQPDVARLKYASTQIWVQKMLFFFIEELGPTLPV